MRNPSQGRASGERVAGTLAALLVVALAGGLSALAQVPKFTPPQPTVPQIFTLQGQYVRLAYNDEGFATLGYRMVQQEIGNEWMLLEVGLTMRKPAPDYMLTRDALSVTTPDGRTIQLASQKEYLEAMGAARNLNRRANTIRDSIDYFPIDADQACAIRFFANPGGAGSQLAFDQVELSWHRACLGRLFFKVPGGIQVGQHYLNVRFANSSLQVPFRTLTPEEEKQFRKYWEEIKAEHEKALTQ